MNDQVLFSSLDLALLVIGGAALALVLVALRYLTRIIPMSRGARAVLGRTAPVVGLAVAIGYLGFVVRMLFREEKQLVSVLLAMLIVALVALGWGSIRDFVAGVIVKAGQALRVGDYVRVGEVEGRVVAMGYRALVVETADGEEAVVPFIQVSRGLVQRSAAIAGAHVHVFAIELPEDTKISELKRVVRDAALCSHWASAVHDPKFERTADGKLEVTVFALHSDYAPEIEAAVREAVEAASERSAPTPAPPRLRI